MQHLSANSWNNFENFPDAAAGIGSWIYLYPWFWKNKNSYKNIQFHNWYFLLHDKEVCYVIFSSSSSYTVLSFDAPKNLSYLKYELKI
jgi:hypothetical protein